MATVDEVKIIVRAEVDQAIAKMRELENVNKSNSKTGLDLAKSIAGYTTGFGLAVQAGQKIISTVTNLAKESVTLAAGFEQAKISWGVLLQDMGAGQKMFASIQSLAARTPLSFQSVEQGARTLKQFGLATAEILPTIKMLGDVSGGNEEKLKGLAVVYGQIMSTGRLMGQDLLQLINQGFNPLQIISQKTGESMAVLKKRMEDGKISSLEVAQAFKTATSDGGQFNGMMDTMAETAAGKWSTAVDGFKQRLATIGDAILPRIKDAIDAVNMEFDRMALADTVKLITSGQTKDIEVVRSTVTGLYNFISDANNNPGKYGILIVEGWKRALTEILPIHNKLRVEEDLRAKAAQGTAKIEAQLSKDNAAELQRLQEVQDQARIGELNAYLASREQNKTLVMLEKERVAQERAVAEANDEVTKSIYQRAYAQLARNKAAEQEISNNARMREYYQYILNLPTPTEKPKPKTPKDETAVDYWNRASGALSAYSDLVKNQGDMEIAMMRKRGATDEEIKAKQNELNKKAFEANKLNKIAELAIETAIAVQKAGGIITPLGAITAAFGVAQAGFIAAQSYVPMAEGGSGITKGPTLFFAEQAGEPFAFGGTNNKRGMNMGGITQNFYIGGSVIAERQVMALGAAGIAMAGRGY